MADGNFVEMAMMYAEIGWKVVPLVDRKKMPRIENWQHRASDDEEQIVTWWEQWPNANIGLRLGESSGVVDIECDSEQAEKDIAVLFGGDIPPTATYTGRRGKHRLFRWPSTLPATAVLHAGSVEVRIGNGNTSGAQSVLPPSIHPKGDVYAWLPSCSPWEIDLAEIPKGAVAQIWNCTNETNLAEGFDGDHFDWKAAFLQGVDQGGDNSDGRNIAAAKILGHLLKSVPDIDNKEQVAFACSQLEGWNQKNRPPMDGKELSTTFNSILSRERTNRMSEAAGVPVGSGDAGIVSAWKLITFKHDPVVHVLLSPLWGGGVELSTKEYLSAALIREVVFEKKHVVLKPSFKSLWHGTKDRQGIATTVAEGAEFHEGKGELTRPVVVAQCVLDFMFRNPTKVIDASALPTSGYPAVTESGDYWVKFEIVREELARYADKVSRKELHKAFSGMGGVSTRVTIAGETTRRHLVKRDNIQREKDRLVCFNLAAVGPSAAGRSNVDSKAPSEARVATKK